MSAHRKACLRWHLHCLAAGIALLKQYANVDCSYDLTPDELAAKVSLVDALIVRSATKVRDRDLSMNTGCDLRVFEGVTLNNCAGSDLVRVRT